MLMRVRFNKMYYKENKCLLESKACADIKLELCKSILFLVRTD